MDFYSFYKQQVQRPFPIYIPTDKNAGHNYIDTYYNERFTPLKEQPINLLEIGTYKFGSLLLFREWFTSAHIVGIDANPIIYSPEKKDYVYVAHEEEYLKHFDENGYSKTIAPGCDFHMTEAYCQETLDLFEDDYFDFIVEDGSHDLEHQKYVIENWTKKLKIGGTLAIEDIAYLYYCSEFDSMLDDRFEKKTYDLRNKSVYPVALDTIIYEIKRVK